MILYNVHHFCPFPSWKKENWVSFLKDIFASAEPSFRAAAAAGPRLMLNDMKTAFDPSTDELKRKCCFSWNFVSIWVHDICLRAARVWEKKADLRTRFREHIPLHAFVCVCSCLFGWRCDLWLFNREKGELEEGAERGMERQIEGLMNRLVRKKLSRQRRRGMGSLCLSSPVASSPRTHAQHAHTQSPISSSAAAAALPLPTSAQSTFLFFLFPTLLCNPASFPVNSNSDCSCPHS